MTRITRIVLLSLASFGLTATVRADSKPDLVLVSVGVSNFQHRAFERGVAAAAKDAQDVAKLYEQQAGRFFGKVESKVLVNEEATRANIEKAFAWAKTRATANSYVVVFMASHAQADDRGQYSFVPHDSNPLLPSTNVTSATMRKYLDSTAGKCFLILDTCHAGAANRLGGVHFATLASCNARELSSEDGAANGFFTRAFVEGMSGKADANGDGVVTLDELESFVRDRLSNLSEGRQSFTMNKPTEYRGLLPVAGS
ncbi:MAG: caspase family protein [Gemmataceae bacterium]